MWLQEAHMETLSLLEKYNTGYDLQAWSTNREDGDQGKQEVWPGIRVSGLVRGLRTAATAFQFTLRLDATTETLRALAFSVSCSCSQFAS